MTAGKGYNEFNSIWAHQVDGHSFRLRECLKVNAFRHFFAFWFVLEYKFRGKQTTKPMSRNAMGFFI